MPEGRPSIPQQVRRQVLFEAGHRCAVCCGTSALELAHIVPWSRVREHAVENLLCLCATCHTIADKEGWSVDYFNRYKAEPCLTTRLRQEAAAAPRVAVELVLPGEAWAFDEERQREVASAVAAYLELPPAEVKVRGVRPGSVRVDLEVPAAAAPRLQQAAERHDAALLALIDLSQNVQVRGLLAALPPCDLVMKGGITSGVVYPKLLARLAQTWRFKSVGGTSAGAIAAAGCAAAEHGRQTGARPDAFTELAGLPELLGRPVKPGDDNSTLFHLFKPAPWLSDHFKVLVGALNRKDGAGIVFGALGVLLFRFWIVAALTVLVMALLGLPALMSLAGLGAQPAAWLLSKVLALAAVVWLVCAYLPGGAAWRTGLALLATVVATALLLRAQAGLVAWGPLALATAALLLWLVLTAAVATVIAALRFVQSLLRGLQRNGWGLVSGHSTDEAAKPQALTDWLVDYFDGLAGRPLQRRPLTFGDLWGLPEGPPTTERDSLPAAQRAIDLQVMTTAVSQHLCYALPLRDKAGQFLYCRQEWEALFPRRVMAWLDQVSAVLDDPAKPVRDRQGRVLRELPRNADLPVVVAVRMSLSFPVLLSAVPLYAIDLSLRQSGQPDPPATKIWFSDGGISSNMPLHFFDAPLPGRPTFAVNLKGEHPLFPIDPDKRASEQKGRVYLPDNNKGGQGQYWQPPADDKPTGLFHFLAQIVETMQNWRDQIQFPYPGYRDRIVQVSQLADEGGLNLNMPSRNIERLADAGEHAAEQLDLRFRVDDGWDNHRDIRLRGFVALVEDLLKSRGLQDIAWDDVARALDPNRYSQAEREMVLALLERMRNLGQEFERRGVSVAKKAPRPLPQMRVSPRI